MKQTKKKMTAVYILKILYSYTSSEYTVTQTAIVGYLNDIGIDCSRKTVGRDLRHLTFIGVPIKRKHEKNGGYYYDHEEDNFFVRHTLWKEEEKSNEA